MTEWEAREILASYAATTSGGLAQAIRVVLAADKAQAEVSARLEQILHDMLKERGP